MIEEDYIIRPRTRTNGNSGDKPMVNTINIPLDDLLEHFRGRGIKTQRRLATILERDPSDISNFLNRKARDSYMDSVCSDIERIFGVVVTGYKVEEK